MSKRPSVLAIIPARGGSKGLPRKNILNAGGKPLIAWTIEAALNAKCVDHVILSSDDEEIIAVAKQYGCDVPFKRPATLATDEASTVDVIFHALGCFQNYDYIVLLQPTSPLRTADDIDEAFSMMLEHSSKSCVSIGEVDETPYWMYRIDSNGGIKKIIDTPAGVHRRQDLPAVYSLNGAIYISEIQHFIDNRGFVSDGTYGYVMPKERSFDIDTLDDFEKASRALSKRV